MAENSDYDKLRKSRLEGMFPDDDTKARPVRARGQSGPENEFGEFLNKRASERLAQVIGMDVQASIVSPDPKTVAKARKGTDILETPRIPTLRIPK